MTRDVGLPIQHAFALFSEQLARWWPREYTWSQDVLEDIGIEPTEGGLCYERGPRGFRCDWGRVLTWAPPRRLVLAWQISPKREPVPDPAKASTIEVRFVETSSDATRLEFEHRDFERHGEGADSYREALASPRGWPLILDRYQAAASIREHAASTR